MRKHLRGRRISSIEQVSFDRIVHLKFGSDFENQESRQEHEFHLYLELFSQGNLILTNWEGRILGILRPVVIEATGKLAVGEIYDPWSTALELKFLEEKDLIEGFEFDDVNEIDLKVLTRGPLASFSPQMIDFCLNNLTSNTLTETKSTKSSKNSHKFILKSEIKNFINLANELVKQVEIGNFGGFLKVQQEVVKEELLNPKFGVVLNSFHPLECFNCQSSGFTVKFEKFNEAVDIYFTRLEAERNSQKEVNLEIEAERKLSAIEAEQQARISSLEEAVEIYRRKGQVVTEFAEDCEGALKVAQTAIETGMDWKEFSRLIETEKQSSNLKRAKIASMFEGLKLEQGIIVLKLDGLSVELLIGLSAHANATRLYDLRTQARLKMERTLAIHATAMKSAALKIRSEMVQSRQLGRVRQLQALRKPFWFEKFAWFVSSDGFLVLAGRDAQQNELIVKKYLNGGDVYVHADVHGAGSLVIKNHLFPQLKTPPPKTLHEAGTFSICFSRAWEAKIVTSAWWVRADQVSKTAPSGEYLGTGSFMIRGQKHFLPPMQLSLSFGFVFGLDEEGRKLKKLERIKRESEGNCFEEIEGLGGNYEKYRIEEGTGASETEGSSVIINTAIGGTEGSLKLKSSNAKNNQKALKALKISEEAKSLAKEEEEKQQQQAVSHVKSKNLRGKHGKEKKIKKKYADQDEEERALRLKLLGSVKKEKVTKTETKKVSKMDEVICVSKKEKPVSASVSVRDDEIVEEEIVVGTEEFIAADYFTLSPDEEKQYTFALPVCFPTSALSSARFRLKLVPGNLKKGKAVKSAVALLTGLSTCPVLRWRDLIRAVPENEMLTVMPGKVALGVSVHETNKLGKLKNKSKNKSK